MQAKQNDATLRSEVSVTQKLLAAALTEAAPAEADYRLALRELSSHRRCEIACNE